MQSLIERALCNERNDVQALRELAVDLTVEGEEPSPRVMTDGGRPAPRPTAGWRSPLGGPQYDGPVPDRDAGGLGEEWPEERIQAAIEERERARATVEPEPEDDGLRADGRGEAGD